MFQTDEKRGYSEMDQPDADCSPLTIRTLQVIDNEVVGKLFTLIQLHNVQVAMGVALV
jgi:hypothetical protein